MVRLVGSHLMETQVRGPLFLVAQKIALVFAGHPVGLEKFCLKNGYASPQLWTSSNLCLLIIIFNEIRIIAGAENDESSARCNSATQMSRETIWRTFALPNVYFRSKYQSILTFLSLLAIWYFLNLKNNY